MRWDQSVPLLRHRGFLLDFPLSGRTALSHPPLMQDHYEFLSILLLKELFKQPFLTSLCSQETKPQPHCGTLKEHAGGCFSDLGCFY